MGPCVILRSDSAKVNSETCIWCKGNNRGCVKGNGLFHENVGASSARPFFGRSLLNPLRLSQTSSSTGGTAIPRPPPRVSRMRPNSFPRCRNSVLSRCRCCRRGSPNSSSSRSRRRDGSNSSGWHITMCTGPASGAGSNATITLPAMVRIAMRTLGRQSSRYVVPSAKKPALGNYCAAYQILYFL